MARLLKLLDPALSHYRDRRFPGNQEDFEQKLRESTTLYIGNLSFFTTEEQIYEVFSQCGDVQRIIMGLDKHKKTPCGFCFVVYYTRRDAEDAVKYLSGTRVDERPIRVDFDWGFVDGRQFGRGRTGGQVRDEYRTDFDEGRGGYGNIVKAQLTQRQQEMLIQMQEYEAGQDDVPELDAEPEAPAANPRFREDNSEEEE